jgi:hypothetical protein
LFIHDVYVVVGITVKLAMPSIPFILWSGAYYAFRASFFYNSIFAHPISLRKLSSLMALLRFVLRAFVSSRRTFSASSDPASVPSPLYRSIVCSWSGMLTSASLAFFAAFLAAFFDSFAAVSR